MSSKSGITSMRWVRSLMLGLVAAASVLFSATPSFADKLHLKNGKVLEGTVKSQGDGYVYFITKIGEIENVEFFTSDQIEKVEKDGATDAPEKPDANKAAASDPTKSARTKSSGATKVCILNFGPPSSWQGVAGSTVGKEICASAFHDAIPILEKEGVQVVVVRINSGGGALSELEKFHKVFEKEFKPRFRTVAWVESAISCAAMSPYVLEEFYFMPGGSLGACTAWHGALVAAKDHQLEIILAQMEEASRKGKRDPAIMRAMQIMEPLSADIDENGDVVWHQDLTGKYVLNPEKQILTFSAEQALKFKFSLGTAGTIDELMKAMSIHEYEVVAKDASEIVDKFMKDVTYANKKLGEFYQKYQMHLQLAAGLQDRKERGAEVGLARRALEEIRTIVNRVPQLREETIFNPPWFEEQERRLRDLMR